MRALLRYLASAPVRFWVMVGAAIALTIYSAGLVWIIAFKAWPIAQAGRQLDILGKALWLLLGMVLAVVLALTGQSLRAHSGEMGIEIGDSGKPQDTTEGKP